MYKEFVYFVRDLYRTEDFIPLHTPYFGGNEKKYLEECIDTTFVSSVGKFVDLFEETMEKYTGAKKAVVCVNGTNALHLALLLVGVKEEDEVLTQALTFIATANAISYIKAKPIFLDVDRNTLGLSYIALKNWLEENAEVKNNECFNKVTSRRIKACVPMHTFGHPVEIDKLLEICKEYYIELVEDAAESLGSFYSGKHTGTFGKVGILSFNGNKTITTGGGGMLLFQDEELGNLAKHLSTQAKVPHRWKFIHDYIGFNYRMPNINAALGCAQMENIEEIIVNKRKTAEKYKSFCENNHINFVEEPENSKSNYWLNALILENKEEREQFLEYTNNNKVMTRPIWGLMNKLPMFSDCQTDNLLNTQWLEERVVNIPSSVRV